MPEEATTHFVTSFLSTLKGPYAKIERANSHVSDLNTRINEFLSGNPYEVRTEIDPNNDSRQIVIAKRTLGVVPEIIPVIVGEVVYNLRSALDQMVCAIAMKNGATNINDVYFPFAGDREKFETPKKQREIRKLPVEARDYICSLKPYKGGNDFFWSLTRINNVDKHQTMIDVGAMGVGFKASATMRPGIGLITIRSPSRIEQPFGDEIRVLDVPRDSEGEGKVEIATAVAFRDIDVIGGTPVAFALQSYTAFVWDICDTFQKRYFS